MYCFVRFQRGLRSVFDESSQMAWFFFCYTFQNLSLYSKQFTQNLDIIYTRICRMNHSIYWWKPHENPCSSFWVHREQTDRRGGGLCFIIWIDLSYLSLSGVFIPGIETLNNIILRKLALLFLWILVYTWD